MPRKPDKREQKRIDKRNLAEESRRAKVVLMLRDGRSLRAAGAAVGRCHMYAKYWMDAAMEKETYFKDGGGTASRLVLRKEWRDLIKVKRPGPPEGRHPKRDEWASRAIGLKNTYPNMGCAKLVAIGRLGISPPTVCEALKDAGLVAPGKKMKMKGRSFCASRPNEMWQIDYVDLGGGCMMLSVVDDCSRKALACDVRKSSKKEDVFDILKGCFRDHGTPDVILSDHGSQWYAVNGGEADFDGFCDSRKIKHKMGRIRHPQTQGKVERFNGSLKGETRVMDAKGIGEKRKIVEGYIPFYNGVRPHWGIDLLTPNDVYYR